MNTILFKHRIKKFLLLQLAGMTFFAAGCLHYMIEMPPQEFLSGKAEPVITNKKIALIGFYPNFSLFQSTGYNAGYRVTTYESVLDYTKGMKKMFKVGKPIEDIPYNGYDKTVTSEKSKEFALAYLTEVKKSGAQELGLLFDVKGNDFFLRKRDVDYYLVGIHGPAFVKRTDWGHFYSLSSIMLSALTLGIFPTIDRQQVVSKFRLYDNKLNLIKEWEKETKFTIIGSFFVNPYPESAKKKFWIDNETNPPLREAYFQQIYDFQNEFREFLSK
jgi:hypothetical protein